jgi:hypothetical protein
MNILYCMELCYSMLSLGDSLQTFYIGGDMRKDLLGLTKQFERADRDWAKLIEKAVSTKKTVALCSGKEFSPVLNEIEAF